MPSSPPDTFLTTSTAMGVLSTSAAAISEDWHVTSYENVSWSLMSLNYTATLGGEWNTTATWNAFTTARSDDMTTGAAISANDSSPDASLIVYVIIRALLGIIITTLNALFVYCIIYFPYLHTSTNVLVAHLCVADFLGGCQQFFVIATIHSIGHDWWASLCLTGEIVNMISTGANMWIIFAISVDSCIFICRPLHYHGWVTTERILWVMAVLWSYVIISAMVTLLLFNRLQSGMACRTVIIIDPQVYNIVYFPQLICLITGFLVCYSLVAAVAWKQNKRRMPQIAPGDITMAVTCDWKIVKMMVLVPGVYFLSMCPAAVFGFMNNRLARESLVYWDRAATILWWTQSWANPLIYVWRNKKFRRAIKSVLRNSIVAPEESSSPRAITDRAVIPSTDGGSPL